MRVETPTLIIGHLEGKYYEGDKIVPLDAETKAQALRDASAARSEARWPSKPNGDVVHGRTIINGKVQSPKAPGYPAQSAQRAEGMSGNRTLPEPADASPRKPLEVASFSEAELEAIASLKQAVGEVAVATTVAERNPGFALSGNAMAQQVIGSAMARYGNNMSMHNRGGMP